MCCHVPFRPFQFLSHGVINHQQPLQKDTTVVMSKLSDLQLQHKSDQFLADLQNYNRKGDKSLSDWIVS